MVEREMGICEGVVVIGEGKIRSQKKKLDSFTVFLRFFFPFGIFFYQDI